MIEPHHIDLTGEWALDVQSGPLIEWWFSKLDRALLYPGRFYFMPPAPGDLETDQLAQFSELAARLFAGVRRMTPLVPTEWGSERMGPVAARMFGEGKISLRRGPPGSRI